MRLGRFEIFTAWDGYFRLDGGAMFGIVPKPLWSKTDQPDERNRILMGLNPMVLKWDKEIFLVDTGIGNNWDEKNKDILQLDRSNNLINSLQEIGISKDKITGVIHTHLHFDHCGGSTEEVDGEIVPAFPNALYYIQQGEWNFALNTNERTKASYLQENFLPLREHKRVEFLHGDQLIARGISVKETGGHTPFHQIVCVESDGQTLCYFGDIIPTASHVKIPYIMGYDTHPMDTLKVQKELIERAVKDRWIVVFAHSPRLRAGYLEQTEKGVELSQINLNT